MMMFKFVKTQIFLLLFAILNGAIAAKELPTEKEKHSASLKAQILAEEIATSKLRIRRLELDEAETISTRAFKKAQREAVIKEYRLRHRLYERQLYYHPIVLATVIVIVTAGIIFCAFQVWRDIRSATTSTTTIKISREGLEVSSSVVGLISLGLSFLFFYLYVTSIYQISESSTTDPHTAITTQPKPNP